MAGFSLEEILQATGGKALSRGAEHFTGISTDSRTIREGELFVALKGERFDGHDFVGEVLKKAAGAVVATRRGVPAAGTVILVEQTLRALQDIARSRRNSKKAKVIGITGTNGKTTTKEMLCGIVNNYVRALCSRGNLNNQIGLPLNLLRLEDEGICILEMGASRKGDIRELCEIALPDYGVITNIGPAHLEGFGSIEAVSDTKLEMAAFVNVLILNKDDALLSGALQAMSSEQRKSVLTFGIQAEADVMAKNVVIPERTGVRAQQTHFDLHIKGAKVTDISLNLLGTFNISNALAASAMAYVLGIPSEVIGRGLAEFQGVAMRLELREMKGAVVISDMYNANPASMEEALKELVRIRGRRAIAVLGDMLELGSYAEAEHRKLGTSMARMPVDVFIGVGPLMESTVAEFRSHANGSRKVFLVADSESARKKLREIIEAGDTVLIKGSRGMNMEKVMEEN
ncbi:MAG: UDP-N-acetylmuramoyl-tripeptide--D-alanyl-D-alanine ligase [bacterium]